jgi:hypothetical protein
MAIIHKMNLNGFFGPDEIDAMVQAYEAALTELELADSEDPINELILKTIVNVTATGERDPVLIRNRVINALRDLQT